MGTAPRPLWLLALLAVAGCGAEPPADVAPPPRLDVKVTRPAPHPRWTDVPPVEPPPPPAAPPPESDLPPGAPLTAEEAALAGEYRLREFIALSGQVPGFAGRLTGTLTLGVASRRVRLRVNHGALGLEAGGFAGPTRFGSGAWRLEGAEVVFEPFRVGTGGIVAGAGPQVELVGPWVARWRVEREGERVLLRAGEFTYERVAEQPAGAR